MADLTDRSAAPAMRARAARRAACAGLLAALLAGGNWVACRAQPATPVPDYKVEAAFLYKFASYVEWPPPVFDRPQSPFVIGVAGADLLGEELARIVDGRSIGGHAVEVRKLRRGDPVSGLHILFVGHADGGKPSDFLASAKGRPVLTVTDSEDAFALGAVINFVIVGDKVRFDVALREAEAANLKVSARLLSVARKVVGGPS
jgi:hypothetical protein